MTIATTENVAAGVAVDQGKVLDYLGLNPSDPKAQAVVAVAQRYDLDPLLKHVIVIPRGGVYITRDGLLHVAHRSRQLDGIVVEQEPTLSEDGREWVARVSVYRKDMGHPFTFPGRYPVSGGNKEYAQEMALKAAEAHALRRAFDVTGLPTYDEQRPAAQPQGGGLAAVLGDEQPAPATTETLQRVDALFAEIALDHQARPAYIEDVIGRAANGYAELTEDDAQKVIAAIEADIDQPFPLDADVVEES